MCVARPACCHVRATSALTIHEPGCWFLLGGLYFLLNREVFQKNWECYTRSGEKKGWVNSSFITHGTFLLPHSWLSSCDEIKIPHSRLRRSWGIFFSSRLLSHSWGSKNVPFVIHEELIFPHSSLRDSWGKNPSLFLSRPGMAQILSSLWQQNLVCLLYD